MLEFDCMNNFVIYIILLEVFAMNRFNLQQKLLLGLTAIITVLVIILASGFYNYLYHESLSKEYKTSQRITERTSSQTDELFKQMDMAALFIVKNSVIQDVLSNLHSNNNISQYDMIKYEAQARDQLKILTFYFPNITNALIFDAKKPFYFHSGLPDDKSVVTKRLKDISWYENLLPEKQLRILPTHQDYWVSIERPVISVIRRLMSTKQEDLGLFEIDIPYWNLQNICDLNIVSEDNSLLVFDKNGTLVYPLQLRKTEQQLFEEIAPGAIFKLVSEKPSASGLLTATKIKSLYTSHKSNFTGLNIVMINKQTSLQKQLSIYIIFIVIAGLIVLAALFFAFFFFVKSLTKPLIELTATIENVSLDNMNLEISHKGHDELKMLNESFNAMFIKLKDSINQIYESKIRETNANLLALQAQINPHFLYNTLSVISASSEKFGNTHTASMCNKLSEMMRYIVGEGNSMVSLKDELNHTLNYLHLMESHYQDYINNSGSMLKYTIEIPAEMYEIKLPKMVLQPLVENSINHGFENTAPPWHIGIYGQYTDTDNWHITVQDNGCGFDTQVLDRIMSSIDEYSCNLSEGKLRQNLEIGGMGVLNTFGRININLRENALFFIENCENRGCIVTFGKKTVNEVKND